MSGLGHRQLRESAVTASRHLFTAGVMSHSGHGNFSVKVDAAAFLLSTTGMVRDLAVEQFAHVTHSGEVLEGTLSSENSEIVAMHSVVYQHRQDVGAIIHTHSPAATAFAVANRPLPCRHEPLLRFGQAETIPVVPWGPRGSHESVHGILAALAEQPHTNALLLGNHGLLVFAGDPIGAAHLVVAIEESAQSELSAAHLGGGRDFPPGALEAVRDRMHEARE